MKLKQIVLLILFNNCLLAQVTIDNTSTWYEEFSWVDLHLHKLKYTISIYGDTLINGDTYFLTEQDVEHSIYALSPNYQLDSLIGVRNYQRRLNPISYEDGVLWNFDKQFSERTVLHDFNLEIGDSINLYCPKTVIQLDTISFGQEIRSTLIYDTTDLNKKYLIDGIGSTNGLFNNPCSGGRLICYSQQDKTYNFTNDQECDSKVTKNHILTKVYNIEVFPNPSSNIINFYSPSHHSSNTRLRMFDINGRNRLNLELYKSERLNKIDISELEIGIYYLQITDRNNSEIITIVKNE